MLPKRSSYLPSTSQMISRDASENAIPSRAHQVARRGGSKSNAAQRKFAIRFASGDRSRYAAAISDKTRLTAALRTAGQLRQRDAMDRLLRRSILA